MKKLLIIFNTLLTFFALGQDAKADFKKINLVYFEMERLSMDVSYELFFDNDTQPSDKESGVYKRDKNKYYTKQSNNELLINQNYMVVVDNDYKTILLDKAKETISPVSPLNMDLDSVFYLYNKVEFYKTGKNKELSAYVFALKKGPYSKIDVVFDPLTFLVKEISHTYRDKMADANNLMRSARLKTTFNNINSKPVFKNEFNEDRFVTNSNKSIKPTANYSNYKLLTNLKKL